MGIVVERQSEDAIRLDVADFCEYLVQSGRERKADASGEDIGTSPETERAIRNMSGLRVITKKDEAGKRQRIDPAKNLARKEPNAKRLALEILTRMNVPRRQLRTVWYPGNSAVSELKWLQNTFADINNGRNSEISIPRLIEVVLPRSVFGCDDFDIRLIDTKGIDQSGNRADLECHFDEPRTVLVLCSS